MWSFKRIMILLSGLLAALCAFAVYSLFLGGIDGLPPLPAEYFYTDNTQPAGAQPPGEADRRLEQSFGAGCEELRRPYRLWLPGKGIAFAAGQFDIDDKGRVRLAPFSVAMYHKSKGPGAYPEISTIRAEVAYLTLDQKVAVLTDLTSRKVIGVELQGNRGISIINNRRTAEKSDDVDILITNGNLFFEEKRNLIWTDGVVRLTDHQTNPPTIVRGRGLDMILTKENSTPRAKSARVPTDSANNDNGGIERLILRCDVEMHFWTDSKSGFLGGTSKPNKTVAIQVESAQAETSLPDKAHIHIHTGGMFVYDLPKEFAWFESPPNRDPKNAKAEDGQLAPDMVHVQRFQKIDGKETVDQLTCDRLELQFRKKTANTPVNPGDPGSDKEIEAAAATARPGNDVVLALDSERMAAYGNYLFYKAGDALNGSQTLLKGDPLRSVKDGNKMVCKDLLLVSPNPAGDGQEVIATGPGQIDMLDTHNKSTFPIHILWRDKLISVKDREGNQTFDLMKLFGEASFMDEVQKQELHGDKIFVWFKNSRDADAKKAQASGANKQDIHRVLAQDKVRAFSPEFIVRQARVLIMTFVPENAPDQTLPAAQISASSPGQAPRIDNQGIAVAPAPKPAPPPEEKKADAPIELQGNEIVVMITTLGTKNEVQELIAKGNVYVFQAGEKPGEKKIDIQGKLLTMKNAPGGHTLVVHGEPDPTRYARVELDSMVVWGRKVTINQPENRADVEGAGALRMLSTKKLDGSSSANGATLILVYWIKNMTFDGSQAYFHSGVEAYEMITPTKRGPSQMLCDDMTAYLDRFVSLKGEKGKPGAAKDKESAKIDHLTCEGKVNIEDKKINERNELEQHSRASGATLLMDNLGGPTILVGPGTAITLAPGSSDFAPAGPPQNSAGAGPEKKVWKLTRVEFPARMFSNNKAKTKNAKFYATPGSLIEVEHFPTNDIKAKMDRDHPPKDGFYLRCEFLSVEGRQTGEKTTQYMIGERNVFFRTDQYYGNADIVKYDESSEIIIFEANPGNIVHLWQIVNNRPEPSSLNSRKVLYNRRTGEMKSDNTTSLSR